MKVVIYQKVGMIVRTIYSFFFKMLTRPFRPKMEALLLSPLSRTRSGRYLTTVVGLRECHTARRTDSGFFDS
jgi:hypothetical protein